MIRLAYSAIMLIIWVMAKAPYDLFSPAFKRDPFPTYAHMRQQDPIYAHTSPGGVTTWYITRYDDVLTVLKDNRHFVKDVRNTVPEEERPLPPKSPTIHDLINQNMLFSDPPDHTRLRALVNQAFTPRRMEQMRGRIQQVADGLLNTVAKSGEMDIMADYALPLPVVVICELLGIPAADQAQVADWSQAIISPGSRGLRARERKRKLRAFVDYLGQMFANRQQTPQDDLTTALVQAEMEGDTLSEAELSSMVALLLVTGHETTVNLIGNGVLLFLQHPDQLQRALQSESAMATAVEEILRFDGPVETSTTRWVSQDVEFKGRQLKQGDVVRVVLSSANREVVCAPRPHQFDVCQPNNKHLAFGHGIHYCLGAPLARLEGIIGFQTLFCRFPTLRLANPVDPLNWRSGVLFRGLERLPVVW